jgi:hypothetical protein
MSVVSAMQNDKNGVIVQAEHEIHGLGFVQGGGFNAGSD